MEKSNEKALKILEQQYKGFADAVNWDFFRGLAQYTKTVQEMMPTKAIVDALEKEREIAMEPYMALSKTSWEEFTKASEEVIKIVKDINEQQEKYNIILPETMTEIGLQLTGNLFADDPLKFLNDNLLEVATRIKALGFGDTIKQFEDEIRIGRDAYAFNFSPTYEKADYEKMTLQRRQETEAWGAWFELPDLAKVVLEPEELNKQARKDLENTQSGKTIKKTKPYLLENFQTFPVQEMDRIRLGKKDAEKSTWFDISKYKDDIRRVHIYITTELIKSDPDIEQKHTLEFEDATSTLYFVGKAIKMAQRSQSNAHDLLKTLFKNRTKVWSTDEVMDDWHFYDVGEKVPKNKVYHAGKAVNDIVAKDTMIKDFLIVTTKNVNINKTYLET